MSIRKEFRPGRESEAKNDQLAKRSDTSISHLPMVTDAALLARTDALGPTPIEGGELP